MTGDNPRRALISVSDKTGLNELAQGLVACGFEILSTGGTRTFLEKAGIPVIDVASYTEFPEMMQGRLKTLHPRVHGGLLGRPDLPDHQQSMREHGILPFEMVVCNLYPFVETISKPGVTTEEAIEQIDIGGPSMVRSAAKNHEHVAVLTRPDQYPEVLAALKLGGLSLSFRRKLAAAAFEMTARYDRAIADYMARQTEEAVSASEDSSATFPDSLRLSFRQVEPLRYGENPHQQAAFYAEPQVPENSLAAAQKLHGKELSYNNLLDLDAALAIVREFPEPASVVIKHNNPCGCAMAAQLADAFQNAYEGDPVSAFGSIIGFNRKVDIATAELLCEPGRFVEAIIAPAYQPEALSLLTTKPKWKSNVRLLEIPGWNQQGSSTLEYRRISGGLLVQLRDDQPDPQAEWKVVTERQPTEQELRDLAFTWLVCKHVKSNAIVFGKNQSVIGVGAGQMSRLDSAMIASYKAGERSRGAVVASDAFFPFRDGIDESAKAGITAVIQPGGSRRDDEVIAACNEHGMAMIFTGRRHFKH